MDVTEKFTTTTDTNSVVTIKIILVDDHDLVLDGFVKLIQSEVQFEIIATFSSAESAMQSPLLTQADILITDLSLPGKNGLDLVEYVNQHAPHLRSIVLSMYESTHYIMSAKALGVAGYISKRDAADVLIDALQHIIQGHAYFSESISNTLEEQADNNAEYMELTTREKEVFKLLALGHEVKEVANELKIAVKTAHVHRRNIMNKFDFKNTFQIMRFAIIYGLIDPSQL